MAKIPQLRDGEWVRPTRHRNGFKDVCCDCGLTHRVQYRVVYVGSEKNRPSSARDFDVEFRAWRDMRATTAVRRPKEKTRAIVAKRAHRTIRKMEKKA